VLLKITVEQNGVILGQSIVEIDDDESLSVAIKSAVDTVRAQDPSKPLWGLGIKVDKLAWLLLAFGVLDLAHATKAATSAPSRALPRRRALCTNWKNPR
jgi:hypothetical protein